VVRVGSYYISGPAAATSFAPASAGTYTISGSCQRTVASSAGHRAAAPTQPLNDNFTCSGTFEVVEDPSATTTTTTTVPPTDVAAGAITANPTFAG
jgi:hypothetical protein